MASGHRKRKAALIRSEVLTPAGYTNVSEADRGNTTRQNNLVDLGAYSANGYSPDFTNGGIGLLSDAISNVDGVYTLLGGTGETTNAANLGITSATKHYFMPLVGGTQVDASSSGAPVTTAIVYSNDGPRASYVPYYLGGTAQTASIKFGSAITGTGSPTGVKITIFGELTSGDQIRVLTGSTVLKVSGVSPPFAFGGLGTASAAQIAPLKTFVIPTASIPSGFILEFSSSAKTSTTPVKGFVVVASASYTAIT